MSANTNSGVDKAVAGGPRIVVGVDGSAPSMRALAWAAAEAERRAAVLEIVHADVFRQEALAALAPDHITTERSILDRAVARARTLAPDIVVIGRICDPPPAKALLAASEGAHLLVVGPRGVGGWRQLALGSVSNECARHAHCPVVIVRPPARPRRPVADPSTAAPGYQPTAV
ncbi:MAG TPA: universal stress protein [Acidimicrobiales bacterium]|nr:universal stress protein [Acidimicrobiales bacterium]